MSVPHAPSTTFVAAKVREKDADDDDDGDDGDDHPKSDAIVVSARRLDNARESVNPSLGAFAYSVSNDAIETRPSGESSNLVNVLLQMPGVSEGGSGELHVRGQRGLQYRINNVIVPEGLTDLADTLRARFADRIELVTGALPAQYGLQAGGVINITTKSGAYGDGGEAELYGGTQGRFEPAFDAMGSLGKTNYYVSGSYQRSNAGLSAPDASTNPLHDHSNQLDGFAYLDRILDPQSRLSLILGASDEAFQLPHTKGLDAATFDGRSLFQRPLTADGTTSYPSEIWGGRENLTSQYGLLSYQRSADKLTAQLSAFLRYSTLSETPDILGDVLFNGLGQALANHNLASGLQAEMLYEVSPEHHVRTGVTASWTRERSRASFSVLPVDGTGREISAFLLTYTNTESDRRRNQGIFLEDEWRMSSAITLNAGLRYDSVVGAGGGHAFSPRLNIVWIPASDVTAHIGYARYFVPANEATGVASARLLAGTSGAWPTTREDAPTAERDDDLDIGVEQKLDHLTLGLDAYWRHADNLLDAVHIGSTALLRPFNYRRGHGWGVELSGTYSLGAVSAWGNIAVASINGRDIATGQAPFTQAELLWVSTHDVATNDDQRASGSFGLSWRLKRVLLSADGLVGSGLPRTAIDGVPNGARMPAYAQFNLAVVYRVTGLHQRPLNLRLDLINAFASRYALQDGTALGGGGAQWGAPQGLYAGLEQSF